MTMTSDTRDETGRLCICGASFLSSEHILVCLHFPSIRNPCLLRSQLSCVLVDAFGVTLQASLDRHKSWVGTKIVKVRVGAGGEIILLGVFEPSNGLIVLPQEGIEASNIAGRNIMLFRQVLQLGDNRAGFIGFSSLYVNRPKKSAPSGKIVDRKRFLELFDGSI